MRWATIVALAGSLVVARDANAQHGQQPDFTPLEFLVGSCWIGTFPDGKQTDEHCFEWMLDGKFIRDRHMVRGGTPYDGETIYGWDGTSKHLSFWYWGSTGMVVTGQVDATPEGLVFPSRYATASGEVELRAVWTRLGPDRYRVANSERAGDAWKPLWSMDLTRKR